MRGNARLPCFMLGSVERGAIEQPADQEGVLIPKERGVAARLNPLCEAPHPG
jgi:hypothetical protein